MPRSPTTARLSRAKPISTQTTKPQPATARYRIQPAWRLLNNAVLVLYSRYRLFLGIGVIYLVLNLFLVRGLSIANDTTNLKHIVSDGNGPFGRAAAGFGGLFVLIFNAKTGSGQSASTYQALLAIIISLAVVWALRQAMQDQIEQLRIRDAFYKGMFPLVPVLCVLIVIGMQSLPVIIGSSFYGQVSITGIAATSIEKSLWFVVLIGSAACTLYLICSSVFAFYIAMLPNMTPMRALRSARGLVRNRRLVVLRKLLFLPLLLVLVGSILLLPIILYTPTAASIMLYLLSIFGIIIIHSYMYQLYRELLK